MHMSQHTLMRVRKSVMEETGNKQIPWEEAALNESFYFLAPTSSVAAPPRAVSSPAKSPVRSAPSVRGGSPPGGGGTITGIR